MDTQVLDTLPEGPQILADEVATLTPELLAEVAEAVQAQKRKPLTDLVVNRAMRRRYERRIRQTPAPKNREQRRQRAVEAARQGRAANAMKPLLKGQIGHQVYLQAASYLELEDELFLLAALEEVKRQHDSLQLHFVTERPEVFELAQSRWFLAGRHLVEAGTEVGPEVVVLEIAEPDRAAVLQAEQARYEAGYQAECARLQAFEKQAHADGFTDVNIQLPLHQFVPVWTKGHGYLYTVADALGVTVAYPETLAPYGDLTATRSRQARRILQAAQLTTRPFILFHLRDEPQTFALVAAFTASFPGCRAISTAQLEGLVTPEVDLLALQLELARQTQCLAVFGLQDTPLYVAWAAGQRNFLVLYTGNDSDWDGIGAPQTLHTERGRWSDEDLVKVVSDLGRILRNRIYR
jgi:hypothetical protein